MERAPSQTAMVPPEESFFTDRRHLETKLTEESASQIPDPVVLFDSVYNALCENYNNGDDLVFPKEVLWLCGAPGSGKGTHAASIMRQRGITEPPIVMSDLLISNESKAAKDAGTLVADGYVLERLLHEMIDPRYQNGVLIDGFPRNLLQAEMVRLMHAKMKSLRATHGRPFRRPSFRVAVLWVPEAVSVQRQLMRGQEARRENAERIKQGLPPLTDVERATDFDEGKARARYRTFKENYAVIKVSCFISYSRCSLLSYLYSCHFFGLTIFSSKKKQGAPTNVSFQCHRWNPRKGRCRRSSSQRI